MPRHCNGFTLTELLIALAILGVIATFTIPKVLTSQQNSKYNAVAKEAAAMLAGALTSYGYSNTLSGSSKLSDITASMNYVSVYTGTVDMYEGSVLTIDCNAGQYLCYKLHSGGVLALWDGTFGTSGITMNGNPASFCYFDPDGVANSSATNAPGKSVAFIISTKGRLSDGGMIPNPSWFSW